MRTKNKKIFTIQGIGICYNYKAKIMPSLKKQGIVYGFEKLSMAFDEL